MRKLLWVFLFTISTQTTVAPGLSLNIKEKTMEHVGRIMKVRKFYSSEFTPKLFCEALIFEGIQNPEIVFRQLVLETGWFTSTSFTVYNNPFGMKKPKNRKTLCKGEALNHGAFNHWYDAIKDYKLWQEWWLDKELTTDEYYNFLNTLPYAEDRRYIRKIKSLDLSRLLT